MPSLSLLSAIIPFITTRGLASKSTDPKVTPSGSTKPVTQVSPTSTPSTNSAANDGSKVSRIFPIIVVVVNLTTRTLVGVFQSQTEFIAASATIFGFPLSVRGFNSVLLNDRGIIHSPAATFMVSYIDPNELSRRNPSTNSTPSDTSAPSTTSNPDSATDNLSI